MSILGFSNRTMSSFIADRERHVSRLRDMKAISNEDDRRFRDVMAYVLDVMATRNVEFGVYEDFFQGGERQKIYFRKFLKEGDEAYKQRLDKSVVINKCRRVIKKGVQCLYATPPQRRMEDDTAHIRMMDVWEYNRVRSGFFHLNLATEAMLYGFQIVKNEYIRKDNRMPVYAKGARNDNNEVRYTPMHPMLTIPIPRKHKQDEMGALIIMTMDVQESPLLAVDIPTPKYLEYIDDEVWLRWAIDFDSTGAVASGTPVDVVFGPNFVNVNPYGDVNVPFTLYRNPGGSMYVLDGNSDLSDVIEPQNKYNETTSDDGHVISHHTFPLLLFTGMVADKEYQRGVADVMSTRNNDANARYVTWDTDLEASRNYARRLDEDMREVSGYSPVSDGKLDNIGQVRNLRGAMVPDILTISEKQTFFFEAEQAHAIATLKMIEWHENDSYPNKELEMSFSKDYIPVDELTKVEAQSLAITSGVENLRDIIKLRHPELESDEEIDAKVKETMELLEMVNKTKTKPVAQQQQIKATKEPEV